MASKKKTIASRVETFANDAELSKADILAVATKEFAMHGLTGARVDAIADRTRTSKRMIYYYFGSKDGLYRAVLEKAYDDIRALDSEQNFDTSTPEESIRRIIDVTFDYGEDHPNFVSLVTVENINRGRNIDQLPSIKERNAPVIRTLADILERGAKSGKFRADVNPVDLHLMISALCVFRCSNRFTFGKMFDVDFSDPKVRKRQKKMIVETVLRYLAL